MSTAKPAAVNAAPEDVPLPEEEGIAVEVDLGEPPPLALAEDLEHEPAAPAAAAPAAPTPPLDPAAPPQAAAPEPQAPPATAPESPELTTMRTQMADMQRRLNARDEADAKAEALLGVETLKTKIADVKVKLKAAYENGDTGAQVELNDQLSDLKADLKINNLIATRAGKAAAAAPAPEPMPLADDWKSKNQWFGKAGFEDETDSVRVIDARVAQAGYDPRTPAYYAELNRRVSKAFPHLIKAGPQPPAPPTPHPGNTPPVAPVRPAAPAGGKRTVTLTQADQRRMEQIGLNPQNPLHCKRYAAELVRAQVAEGGQS